MEKNKEMPIVIAATIFFGVLGKILVGIPYMPLGDFSIGFCISFSLWWMYDCVLFWIAEQKGGDKILFIKIAASGFLAAFVKSGMDTLVDLITAQQPNMLTVSAVKGAVMISYMIGLDFFLFLKVGKRKIKEEKREMNSSLAVLCALIAVYAALLFRYMGQVKYAVERFGNMPEVRAIGLDNAIWNLTTTLAKRSETVRTMIYVGCFIILWHMMGKITVEEKQ